VSTFELVVTDNPLSGGEVAVQLREGGWGCAEMTISRGQAGYSGELPETFDVALARLSSPAMVLLVS